MDRPLYKSQRPVLVGPPLGCRQLEYMVSLMPVLLWEILTFSNDTLNEVTADAVAGPEYLWIFSFMRRLT